MHGQGGNRSLFVVEDDAPMREMLQGYLERQGLHVVAMDSAERLLDALRRGPRPDLVVLDVGLPCMSGLDACVRLRNEGDSIPIILLTARSDEIDRVLGLEVGADDYLSKPFSARELLARTRAVLRRCAGGKADEAGMRGDALVRIGDCVFSPSERCLRRGGEIRVLNTVEYALLGELTARPGVPVPRERLREVSHAPGHEVSLRAVDAAMVRLRRTLEPDPALPRFLQTVRGFGYVFVPPAARARA